MNAFALTGRLAFGCITPRALPWARSFCPFGAYHLRLLTHPPLNRQDPYGRVGMAGMPYPPTDCHSYIKLNINTYLYITPYPDEIGQEVNVTHKRHLPPTFAFTDLPHHRTCGSAYGGFGLSHLTMCGKLFSAIPSRYVTSILLSDSVLSYEQRVPIGHLTTKDSQGSSHLLLHCPILPFPIGTRTLGTMASADFSRQVLLHDFRKGN